ncbi:MAG: hypothetical protein JWO72_1968, partial [Caulobacteraceae bacterium]|nr:hypothetical protein [Caulobacteraceae bacterium]
PAARPAGPPPPKRPGLLYKEEWTNPTGEEVALSATAGAHNPDLELKVYGVGASLRMTGKDGDENNPSHLFSGECKSSCAFAFRNKKAMADLTGLARVRVNTKMSGFHKVYPIVKLASGDWYIGDRPEGSSTRDWIFSEFNTSDLRWTKLDIANVVTKGNPVDKIDLSKVDEIGFADLMPGSGHGPGGWFDVAQVEVYAKPAAR